MGTIFDKRLWIAKKLKELREQQGLTQTEVGRLIGRAFTTVASWESGKGQPDIDTFFKLMRVYDVSNIEAQFGYAAATELLSAEERQHIAVLRHLSPEGRRLVTGLGEGLCQMQQTQENVLCAARNGTGAPMQIKDSIAMLEDEPWQGEKK